MNDEKKGLRHRERKLPRLKTQSGEARDAEAPDNESDGSKTELVQKTSRDANGVAHVLALIEAAGLALESGDEETALTLLEAAYVIYHGTPAPPNAMRSGGSARPTGR